MARSTRSQGRGTAALYLFTLFLLINVALAHGVRRHKFSYGVSSRTKVASQASSSIRIPTSVPTLYATSASAVSTPSTKQAAPSTSTTVSIVYVPAPSTPSTTQVAPPAASTVSSAYGPTAGSTQTAVTPSSANVSPTTTRVATSMTSAYGTTSSTTSTRETTTSLAYGTTSSTTTTRVTTTTSPAYSTTISTPATSATAAAVLTANVPNSATNSGKKGLSYNNANVLSAWAGKAGWYYNWDPTPNGGNLPGAEYLPMIWCANKGDVATWTRNVNNAISTGSKHVLGFNEPDQPGQCSITVDTAIAAHKQYMQPFVGKVKIGSPGVTNGGGEMGLNYLDKFLSGLGCVKGNAGTSACPVDFLAVHWYQTNQYGAANNFQNHISAAITLGQKYGINQVYVTEFGLWVQDPALEAAFIQQVGPWLESQPAVAGYAAFMATDGFLMTGTQISSPMGAAYAAI